MKSTGIVRKIDELGRIVLPIEMRRTLDIAVKDPLEIYVDGTTIILKKYVPDEGKAAASKKKYVCSVCQREIEAAEVESTVPLRIKARVKGK